MADIPKLNELKGADRVLTSIGNKLDAAAESTRVWAKGIIDAGESADDLANKLDRALSQFQKTGKGAEKIEALANQLDDLGKKAGTVGKQLGEKLEAGIDKVAKKMAGLQVSILGLGLDSLISGIQRVYDLYERWTKVSGELNKKIGGMSGNMAEFRKSASQAEGVIRGLTDAMGEGTQMFADFAISYGKMDTKKSGLFVAELARGFDLGGEAAGKLSRMLDNISENVGAKAQHEQAEYFKTITLQADKAGIPLNAFAKDIAENTNLVSQFGKIGAKTFIQSAAYLKKFNIGLKEMDQFMSKFDTFDDAASSIAKLNTAFGTSINSLNMMLEQNPAKRFETIRSALLAQGKTFNTLSRNEIQLLKQQTGLDEQALSAMLDKKNAGMSYEKFLAEKDRKDKERQKAEDLMRKQLQKTATTMFAFGQAADKITTAIANAIKPFLELLGLVKKGEGPFGSFSEVMGKITQRITDFFNGLARNPEWIAFMKKAAGYVKSLAEAIADFFSPGKLDKHISMIISAFKSFEKWSLIALGVWGGFKAAKAIKGVFDLVGAFSKLKSAGGLAQRAMSIIGPTGGTAMPGPGGIDVPGPNSAFAEGGPAKAAGGGMGGKIMGGVGKAVMGAGIGYGVGKVTSMGVEALGGAKESTAGNIGAAALGGIGMLIAGPLGAALGGVIGQTFGDLGSFLYDEFKTTTKSERDLNAATEQLKEAQEKTAKMTQRTADLEGAIAADKELTKAKWKKDTRNLSSISEKANKLDKKKYETGLDLQGLSQEERDSLADRLKDLRGYGIESKKTEKIISEMAKTGHITADQLDLIGSASGELREVMKKLAEETDNEVKAMQAKEAANNQFEKLRQDRVIAADEADIQRKKEAMERAEHTSVDITDGEFARNKELQAQFDEMTKGFFGMDKGMAKAILTQQYNEKGTKELRAKAKADFEAAQTKKLQDQKKSETIEQQHQENLYQIALKNQIMQGKDFQEYRATGAGKGLDAAAAFNKFVGAGEGGKINTADLEKFLPGVQKMAGGGIVRQPTVAIVGESGPEAVIPLNARSRGMDLTGGGAAGGPVNYAGSKRAAAGGEMKVVAGDVYLDGKLVGRHLARSILNDARG